MLKAGWVEITIFGRSQRDARHFTINLFNANNNIMLHINIRFDENVSF